MFVFVLAKMTSSASPTRAGRSMHTVVVSRKSAAMPYSRSSVAWMTSFWTSPYSDTAISWRWSSWRTSISGSCSASWARAARRLPCCLGLQRKDDRLERRPREPGRHVLARRRLADRIADADGAEAPDRRHLAGRDDVAPRRAGRGEDLDRGRLRVLAPADADALARTQRAGEQAHVGDALAGGGPLDLEDATGDRRVRVARRRPPADRRCRASSASIPIPARGRTDENRVDEARVASGRPAARAAARAAAAASSRTKARRIDSSCSARTSASMARCSARPDVAADGAIGTTPGDNRRFIAATTASGSAPARSSLLTKISVGTPSRCSARNRSGVWGWTPSTAETTSTAPSRTPRTRSTSAMKSGWPGVSTRLTARSPTRNEATADADGDAAFALELERIGLGGSRVDGADALDGAGGEEKSLGEGGLTRVDVGEDAEIERAHGTSCRARRWRPSGWT